MIAKHICTLGHGSESHLPPASGKLRTFFRTLRKLTIVSPLNTRCRQYFRSNAAISLERKRHIQSNLLYIIHPFSLFRLCWEAFMTVVFLFALILNPLDFAFQLSFKSWTWKATFIFIINFICALDIFLDFITGRGRTSVKEVVLDPLKIAKNKFKSPYFYLELISCVPALALPTIETLETKRIIRLILILKCVRIRRFLIYFERTSYNWQQTALTNTIIEYSIVALLLVHWTGCVHYAIPSLAVENYHSSQEYYWIDKIAISDFTLEEIYVRSVYRAANMLLNVDYEIDPTTVPELIIVIFTLIVGNIYLAVMSVVILQMMSSRLSGETKYQEIINQVKEYMRCKQLPIITQKRLLAYYEYRFQKKYFREDLILRSMSVRLRREANVHCYRRLIESVSIFKDMPRHLIVEIVNSLKEEIFLPNDIIVRANTFGDCMYFIASGTVCVKTISGKEICHLHDGAYFGEIALLMKDQKRISNVYALEICEIYKLERKHFKRCFLHNSDVYKKIEEVACNRFEKTSIIEELHKKYLLSSENATT